MFKMWPESSPSLTDQKSGLDPTIVASEVAPVSDAVTSLPSSEGQLDVDVSSAGLQRLRSVSNDSATLSGNDGPPTPTPPAKRSRLAAPISVGQIFSITVRLLPADQCHLRQYRSRNSFALIVPTNAFPSPEY